MQKIHLRRKPRRLTDEVLALKREYDATSGATMAGTRRHQQIREALASVGIGYTARRNCYGASEYYWDLGAGHLTPTTTESWRQNQTYCPRCQKQRGVPHLHSWWFFWVYEELS
jgi:hypothetical protein